jgi:hypothetical protein
LTNLASKDKLMRKITLPSTTLYTFTQRADLTLSTHTADLLTDLLKRKEAFRRKWQELEYQKDWVDYAAMAVTTLASGALFSLVTTWLIR